MSEGSLFSAHWYRVRDVRPRLADDVSVHRHVYRGRVCRVLRRRSTNAFHRLDGASFRLVGQLDGRASVAEVWERALRELDRDAPTQDEWMGLLAALHASELLVLDRRVPAEALFERGRTKRSRERRQRYLNPLFLRVALHDPDRWLDALAPLWQAVFSRTALWLWLALLLAAALALFAEGGRLAAALSDPALLSAGSALTFLLVYPPLKLLHELAHALAVKRRGGAVHEVGVALMVLMPLPYVDASASAAFPERRDRMLVSAAGILVELAFAAVGALLWCTGAGALADVGLVLLLVGGLSTLLVNGNPLLKFDGYYLLADALEIPNLAARSRRAVLERLRAWLTGRPAERVPVEDPAERAWLLAYGVLSALYRTALMLSIAWMLSGRWPVLGLLLGGFAVIVSVVLPLWKGLLALARDPALGGARPRLLAVAVPLLFGAGALWLPLPHASVARGVAWLPESAVVRAAGECEVVEVAVAPGSEVERGERLFRCSDAELIARERASVARLDELGARLAGTATRAPADHARLEPALLAARELLDDVRDRLDAEWHVAGLDGRFDIVGTAALTGRAFARGDVAGYVVPPRGRTIRVAIGEREVALVDAAIGRGRGTAAGEEAGAERDAGADTIAVRIPDADNVPREHRTRVLSRTPKATFEIPSAALGTVGGGEHEVVPDGDGRRLLAPVFDIELAWPPTAGEAAIGAHVDVRFAHSPTPLARRLRDALRRALDARGRA